MNCTTTCNNCNKCDDKCPYCGYKGKEVKLETVAELTKNKCVFFENGEKIYICTNKKCDLVYFQVGNPKVYLKEEIKVPVWFKEKYKNYHDKFNGIDDGHASQKVIDVIKKVSR